MKLANKYITFRLAFIIPLLITILVAGSNLIFIYNLPRLEDPLKVTDTLRTYLIFSTLLSFLVGLALAYAILVPIRKIIKLSSHLNKASFTIPWQNLRFEREIAEVFVSLDKTRSSLIADRKKELLQRLSSLGLMAAGVAHELRNPLGSIRGLVDLIDEDLPAEDNKKRYTQVIITEINRLEESINKFLCLCSGKIDKIEAEKIEINALIDETLFVVTLGSKAAAVKIVRNGAVSCEIWGFRQRLKQAFLNIILNAYDAMPEGGTLKITTQRINGSIQIKFCDSGCGISEKDIRKIFEPFFTTKDNNVGLGLTMAQQIILSHAGILEVDSKEGQGASFVVTLPLKFHEPQ